MARDGEGWTNMDSRGQNGFLNVMMVLKWWRDATGKSTPDWEGALDDVTWVLQEMRREQE